jgi:hypothetical protein
MDPLTSLKVFIIVVMSFTLVAAFRRFILETPPGTPSDRFLLLMREIVSSVFVGMVATFQWSAFTGWRLPVTLVSFAVGIGIISSIRKVLSKSNVKDNPTIL